MFDENAEGENGGDFRPRDRKLIDELPHEEEDQLIEKLVDGKFREESFHA
jgi:hypothetical protein